MTTSLRYRLFRLGKFTPDQVRAAAGPGILVAVPGISVRSTSTALKIPGRNTNSGTRLLSGALVISAKQVLAALGSLNLTADLGAPPGADPAAELFVEPEGVRVSVRVNALIPQGSGTAEMRFRLPIDGAVLSALAATSGPIHLPPVVRQQLSRRL